MCSSSSSACASAAAGLIELDPSEPVIIVNFVTQTVDLTRNGDDGKPAVLDSEPGAKRLRIGKFHAGSSAEKFASALQTSCNLIHESKIPHIINLLEELRERIVAAGGEGGDALSATTPLPLAMQKAASERQAQLGGTMDEGRSSRAGAGAGHDMDLRASAPAMPSAKQRAAPSNSAAISVRHSIDEQGEDEQQAASEDAVRRPVRPGSASRTRANPSPLDIRSGPAGGDLHGPAPSQSPTFSGNNNGSNVPAAAATSKSQKLSQQQQQVSPPSQPQQRAPLTEAEEEQLEHERQLKREREERMAKEARKARNAKRAEMSLAQSFKGEQDRCALVERREAQRKKRDKEKNRKAEQASLKHLDEYIETLYEEEVATKIRGTALILQLVQRPENLDHFIDNDTVLGALARVLKDEYKRSPELTTQILEIFFCFSSFRQLHPILLQNKIGETTMKVLDLEIKRYELRREKEERARLDAGGAPLPSGNPWGDISTHYVSSTVRESADDRERHKKLTTFLLAQEKLLFVCFYILLNLAEDFHIELKMKSKKLIRSLVSMLHRTGAPYVDDRGFLDELHLLVLTFLKKLSIFEENKREMKENNIIANLTVFLNNCAPVPGGAGAAQGVNVLSPNGGSASAFASAAVPPADLPAPNPEILEAVLRLLYNLSFDGDLKKEMALSAGGVGGGWVVPRNFGKANQQQLVLASPNTPGSPTAPGGSQQGMIQLGSQLFNPERELHPANLIVRIIDLLKKPNVNVRLVSARVLYNLTSDLNFRPLVERALLPDISVLASLILRCPNKLVDKELIALAVNVTLSPEVVDGLVTGEMFHALIKRVHQTFDPLLIKLLRNISSHPEHHHAFKKYMHELVGMTLKAPTHDFLLESLAILANITLPDISYSELISQHGLLEFLMTHLQVGFADDDIVLECVQLLGTLAIDPRAASMLAHGHLIRALTQLLTDKIEDLDIVVHIVFTLFKFLLHRETREAIMLHQHLTDCLLDLVVDPSPEVRHLANMCLDIIMVRGNTHRQQGESNLSERHSKTERDSTIRSARHGVVAARPHS